METSPDVQFSVLAQDAILISALYTETITTDGDSSELCELCIMITSLSFMPGP